MADNPQRMNKNMMNSPYFSGYSQGKQGREPAYRPNMTKVGQGGASVRRSSAPPVAVGQMPGRPIYSNQSPVKATAKYQKFKQQEYDAYSKQKRKERDYFFVMRRGICFFIMLVSIVMLAALALSFVKVMPEYTSFFIEADTTLAADRPEGYTDASKYISVADPIYGLIGNITNKPDAQYTYQANVDALKAQADANPAISMLGLFATVYEYHPIAIAMLAIFTLTVFIMSFAGMFNRRIYKGFGALAIIMLIMSVVVLFSGMLIMYSKMGMFAPEQTTMDFSLFLKIFSANTPPVDATAAVPYLAGYAIYAIAACPVVILFLSVFARRKIPYSVFDRI